MKPLTKTQKETLDYLKEYIKVAGYAPTINQIGNHFKISDSSVHDRLRRLEEKGYITKEKNQPRSIQINEEKIQSNS